MHSTALRCTLLALICLATAGSASAGTITTWTGSGTNNRWSTAGNWSVAPNTSGTFSLVYTGTPTQTTSFNNVGAVKVDSIQFLNDGSAGKTSRFTISNGANTLSLTSGGSVTSATVSGTTLQDGISTNLNLLGSGTFNLGANHNLLVTGTLNAAGTLVKAGAGSLFLQGATTLNGLSIDQGLVQLNATTHTAINGLQVQVGSSASSGTLQLNSVGTSTSTASFRLGGNATIQSTGTSNVTYSSSNFNVADATVTSPVTLSLSGGGGSGFGTQTVEGVIQDNSATGKVGLSIGTVGASGTTNVWVVKGVNTYTGDTTVTNGGRLLMDGVISGSSATTSSGYLGGSGTFGGAVSILAGTLSPGGTSTSGAVINDTIATLTVGSLSLSGPATTAMTITGSSAGLYDQIVGSSSINYGGTLALTLSGSYVDYTTFDLFSGFTSNTGDLSSITLAALGSPYAGLSFTGPDGSGDWYTGWTTGNQQLKFSESTGTLTVVPEPSTIVFAGIGMAMFGWSTWTRRRAKARRQAIEASIA